MISLNCALLTDNIILSKLFGHVRGAFTGAVKTRHGVFDLADQSTLFLDEVGELSLDVQAKLLRVLQEGTFTKMGAEVSQTTNVRIISATNRNLGKLVEKGKFREDLYYRLATFKVKVHPLRRRKVDILPLMEYRLSTLNKKYRKAKKLPGQVGLKQVFDYSFPGNIRELFNIVERAYHYADGKKLKFPKDMSLGSISGKSETSDLSLVALAEAQVRHIRRVLDHCGWKVSGPDGAAAILGLQPSTLRSKMKKLGIERPV